MAIQVIQQAEKTSRVLRKPQHTFAVKHTPFAIQPMLIAPVLPGETMQNLLVQARGVIDPISNPLIGWWTEYYFFYVKHRVMPDFESFKDMVMTPGFDVSGLAGAANPNHYHTDGIDWVAQCLEPVVRDFFRDEDEAWDVAMRDGLPLAKLNHESWLDSVKLDSTTPAADDDKLPGQEHVETDPTVLTGFDAQYAQFEHMRAMKLTDATYEDWLRQYGVTPPAKERVEKPELIRYLRNWQYPVNTIDPSDGSPSSAVSWAVSERADKARAFNEPGFIFGVSVVRPKVYLTKQMQNASTMLTDAYAWLPALLDGDPYTSLRQFAVDAGPLDDTSEAYWVDLRDLFMHGDQFTNMEATDKFNQLALPSATLGMYAADADVNALFTVPENRYARQDGICSLQVKSRLRDHT